MLRTTELPYTVEFGTTFEHTRQGLTYAYRVLGVIVGEENCNDRIILQDLKDLSSMEVEPEWFNQRKVRITTKVNLYLWFEKDMAYYLNITPDKADSIIKSFDNVTNRFTEVVL